MSEYEEVYFPTNLKLQQRLSDFRYIVFILLERTSISNDFFNQIQKHVVNKAAW